VSEEKTDSTDIEVAKQINHAKEKVDSVPHKAG